MRTLELNEDNDFDGKYGFVFDHTFITNPIESICGRFDANPEEYGFTIFDTGWDCIAHSQEFLLDGKKVLMLISDDNNLVTSKSTYAQVAICNPELIDDDFQASIIDQYVIPR